MYLNDFIRPVPGHIPGHDNSEEMPLFDLKNVRGEGNAWKRSLRYMSDENILMKTALAEILQGDFDLAYLPQVENFQTLLLKEEEFIHLLRHNISELDAFLSRDNPNENEIEFLRSRLQQQMRTAELRFNKLKSEVYDFLSAKV